MFSHSLINPSLINLLQELLLALDTNSESSALNGDILEWARNQLGSQVGSGQCWDLAEQAIIRKDGKSSRELTLYSSEEEFHDQADYVWGNQIALKKVKPGDILQFRDYEWKFYRSIDISFDDGGELNIKGPEYHITHPINRHTAIVSGTLSNGQVDPNSFFS
ncbi:MAG: hypothetical protein Q3M24_19200 [Candidatus Electrothrix aestuarii]|uniref:BBC1/AIM3 cysteine proteinase-fold domain-containing protein n=1 Tax=Candidatus Electrothrix aestuarii TaxID=3062594 RepID=A0AAU8LU32_9BACT